MDKLLQARRIGEDAGIDKLLPIGIGDVWESFWRAGIVEFGDAKRDRNTTLRGRVALSGGGQWRGRLCLSWLLSTERSDRSTRQDANQNGGKQGSKIQLHHNRYPHDSGADAGATSSRTTSWTTRKSSSHSVKR